MEHNIHDIDKTTQPDDAQLQERVGRYYHATLGAPAQHGDVWNSIAGRLGEQEGRDSVEFARSLNGLYGQPQDTSEEIVTAVESARKANEARKSESRKQRYAIRWGALWSPAVAAGVVLAIVGVLVALLAVASNMTISNSAATPTVAPTPAPSIGNLSLRNLGFEEGTNEWHVADSQGYTITPDESVAHGGKASLSIASTASTTNEWKSQGVSRAVDPAAAVGARVRFSGYIKTQDVIGSAVFVIRVDGKPAEGEFKPRIRAFDNMTDRAPSGTTDWTRYDLVVDVPDDTRDIMVAVMLTGGGQMWADDLSLEIVDKSVSTTDLYGNAELRNVDFEDNTRWWSHYGVNAKNEIDNMIAHGGNASARVEQTTDDPEAGAGYTQSIRAENYAGKRVRFSAYLKTEGAQERAGLWLGAYENFVNTSKDFMETRPVNGTTDWTLYELVIDVPANSDLIMVGADIQGAGRIWVDDAKLEVVGDDVRTTGLPIEKELVNGSFESGLQPGWQLVTSGPDQFKAGTGSEQAYEGQGAYLRVIGEPTDKTASLQQTVRADEFRGKTVRISAFINADLVPTDTYLWADIYAPGQIDASKLSGEAHVPTNRSGSNADWELRTIVLYVPDTAETITLGVKLTGQGEVWIDNVKLESALRPMETPEPRP